MIDGAETVAKRRGLARPLPAVKPWIAAAAILAVTIISYYAFQGYRYWNSSEQASSLSGRIDSLSTILGRSGQSSQEAEQRLEESQERLGRLKKEFNFSSIDGLIAILSSTAEASGIGLASITVPDPSPDTLDGIKYRLQPIAVTVHGERSAIYGFLSALNQKVPVMTVSSIRMAGLEFNPGAKLRLIFYLSPELAPASEDAATD